MKTRRGSPVPPRGAVFLLTAVLLAAGGGAIMLHAADPYAPPEQSDINRDGTVDSKDLLTFQREWHQQFSTVEDLVPIGVGNYWRYDTVTTRYTAAGTETVPSRLSITVITTQNTTDFPGHTVSVIKERPTGGPDRYLYQELANGAFLLRGEGTIYPGPVTEYDPPEVWLQGPAVPGRTWIGSAIKDTQDIPAVATSSFEAVGETVVTPAGTYTNCTRLVRTQTGSLGGRTYQANSILWFEPGLGLVQAEYHRSWTATPVGPAESVDITWSLYQFNLQ